MNLNIQFLTEEINQHFEIQTTVQQLIEFARNYFKLPPDEEIYISHNRAVLYESKSLNKISNLQNGDTLTVSLMLVKKGNRLNIEVQIQQRIIKKLVTDDIKVDELKNYLSTVTKLSTEALTIKYGDQLLEADRPLKFYNITNKSKLIIPYMEFIITVKYGERCVDLLVSSIQTIETLYKMAAKKLDLVWSEVNLSLRADHLSDFSRSIIDYNICEGDTLINQDCRIRFLDEDGQRQCYLSVWQHCKVQVIKKKLRASFQLTAHQVTLKFEEKKLDRNKSISVYKIRHRAIVQVKIKELIDYKLMVRLDAKTYCLKVDPNILVKELKTIVSNRVGITSERIILVYNGEVLEEKLTLLELEIKSNSVILLLSTVFGGRTFERYIFI